MREQLLAMLVSLIVKRLTSDQIKEWADMGLDFLEEFAADTSNPVDDALLAVIRVAFEVPEYED